MSDPAHGGYTCHGPMAPVRLWEFLHKNASAYLCDDCLKWRHGFPPGDARRLKVVTIMERLTRQLYEERTRHA